jgi:hypothetical protein
MKNIEPINIWMHGSSKQASILSARIINDDLSTQCSFYYELRESDTEIPPIEEGDVPTTLFGSKLSEGNVYMSGSDYQNWDGTNQTAYEFIATKLNLSLVN